MPRTSVHSTLTPAARRASKWPSLALALALHLGLGILIFWGWRSHSIQSQEDAAPAQVGLWTSADIAHAAQTPAKPKEASKPKIEAQPEAKPQQPKPDQAAVPDEVADIHLDQAKPKKKHKPTPSPTPRPQPTIEPTAKPKAKPSPAPTHKPTPDPRIAQEKAAEKAKNAGQAGGSTTSQFNGQGKAQYKPSNEYSARLGRAIRGNTNFDASDIIGNPSVEIEIRLSPDGTILGKPRIVRSSGQTDWDAAAVEGIERAEVLPRDPILGMAPPVMVIDRKPKD